MLNRQQVFISYNQADTDFAHQLGRDLQKIGVQIWIAPESIQPGENWVNAINQAFEESSHVIVILSPASVQSDWVNFEASMAIRFSVEKKIKLIPVELKPCQPPASLTHFQMVSFAASYEEGFNTLKGAFVKKRVAFHEKMTPEGLTTETPLGKTLISNPQEKPTNPFKGIESQQYVHPAYQFQLSWPGNGKWILREDFAMQSDIDLILQYHQTFAQFNPNVNVTTEKVGMMKIRQWLQTGNTGFQNMGYIVMENAFDDLSQSAMRTVKHMQFQPALYQIQRAVIHRGIAYVVTGSKLEADYAVFPELYEEMRQIINSFAVLQ